MALFVFTKSTPVDVTDVAVWSAVNKDGDVAAGCATFAAAPFSAPLPADVRDVRRR